MSRLLVKRDHGGYFIQRLGYEDEVLEEFTSVELDQVVIDWIRKVDWVKTDDQRRESERAERLLNRNNEALEEIRALKARVADLEEIKAGLLKRLADYRSDAAIERDIFYD